jgi:hypothetical protein
MSGVLPTVIAIRMNARRDLHGYRHVRFKLAATPGARHVRKLDHHGEGLEGRPRLLASVELSEASNIE